MAAKASGSTVSPVGLAFLGMGTFIQGQAKYDALQKQSQAEKENANFYRIQANFAEEAGQRQENVYHDESTILFGEQESGFAKGGVDTSNSSFFMASQMLQRNKGEDAIKTNTDMNVMLAQKRAEASDQAARDYASAGASAQFGTYVSGAATLAAFL